MTDLVRPLAPTLQAIELLLRLGRTDTALATIEALARLHPELHALQLYRGWVLLNRDERGPAITAFRLAVGRDPLDPIAWHGVAECSSDPNERAGAADRSRLLNPDGPQAQLWHDIRGGRPHLAVTALHTLQGRFPERPELTIWLAEVQRRLGNEAQARALLEPLLRRRPRSIPALFLAAALSRDGEQIQQFFGDALRLDPLATTAARLFAPDPPPFAVPAPPVAYLPAALAEELNELVGMPAPPPTQRPRPLAQHGAQPPARIAQAKSAGEPAVPSQDDDRDTAAALSAVEQATQRLFGKTPLAADPDRVTALLVTHRGALVAAYGGETTETILKELREYGTALLARSIHTEIVLLDARESLAPLGNVPPVAARSAAECKRVIDAVRAFLDSAGREVDAVVMIGGDSIVPFHRLPNPSQDADDDVPTDNPYGSAGGSDLAPDLIVARFPDGGADGGRLLLDQLERAAEYHHSWHLAGPNGTVLNVPFMRRFTKTWKAGGPVVGWGVSAEAWQAPSQAIYAELGSARPLVLCPPATPDTLEAGWPADGRLLYFNVHGIQGGPNWYGQSLADPSDAPLPVVLTPDDVGAVAPAMICLSEACFGAEIAGRTADNAIALRLLQRGALAFLGSTVTAYGAVALPLGGADLLVQQTVQNLRKGHPLGRAVVLARDWMAREMVERQGYLDPDDAKTLLSFVVLGDPWATPYTRPVLERKTSVPQITPVVLQRRPVAANMVAPSAVTAARQLIAKVVPNLARAQLTAQGQGRPDRIAKGQASAVVFSATDALPTTDGRALEQVVRVTVSGGMARKLLLSR